MTDQSTRHADEGTLAYIAELEAEVERGYQMLEVNGVPRERAKSIGNGIEVLRSRLQKAADTWESDHSHVAGLLQSAESRLAAVEADAARFHYLQNIPVVEAQQYFWNYQSRKQRAAAIDSAIRQLKEKA